MKANSVLFRSLIGGLAWALVLSASAFAVQNATVQGDAAPVMSAPGGGNVLEEVPAGTALPASSKPTQGFYKVKTPSGKIGWIAASALGLSAGAGGEGSPPPPPSSGRRGSRSSRGSSRSAKLENNIGVKVFGSLTMFKLDTLNTAYGITDWANGAGFGGELRYRFNLHWTGLFRVELESKALSIDVTASGQQFTTKASAMPVEFGAEYNFMDPKDEFQLSLGGLLGFGVGTKFSSIAEGATAPNETIYSGTPLIFHIKFAADYYLSSSFSIGAELGYRMHKLAQAVPTTIGATTSDDKLLTGSTFKPEEVNMSGITLGVAVTLWF